MANGPDFRIVIDYRGDYMVVEVEGDEVFSALPTTFASREQAEQALAELERAEAEEGEAA